MLGTAEISIYVNESARRRGVGHRLLAEAIQRRPSLALTALIGCIFAHNTPSLGLFARASTEWNAIS
jgi:L-amino acid N-acyltransferase YncA